MFGRHPGKATVVLTALLLLLPTAGCLATEAGTEAVQDADAAYTVPADELVAEYETNEVAADQKYADQVVSVSGSVTDIGKDISDTAYVILGGTGSLDGVQCFFADSPESDIAALEKGQEITVKGKVSRKMMNVVMKDCALQGD